MCGLVNSLQQRETWPESMLNLREQQSFLAEQVLQVDTAGMARDTTGAARDTTDDAMNAKGAADGHYRCCRWTLQALLETLRCCRWVLQALQTNARGAEDDTLHLRLHLF